MSQRMVREDNLTASTIDEDERLQTPKLSLSELEDSLPSCTDKRKSPHGPRMVHYIKVPKVNTDDSDLGSYVRPAVVEFFVHVNNRFSDLFTNPPRGQTGPYLIRKNVSTEVFGHFLREKQEHWATFYQEPVTGDVYYNGDPSFVHESVIQELNQYIILQIASCLDDAPLLPQAVETEVLLALERNPRMRRGDAIMAALFQQLGSMDITLREQRNVPGTEHIRRARPIQISEGRKEADALMLCRWNVNRAILALEVAYSNESLIETGRETYLWCKQRLLAFGLKINPSQPSSELDPFAMLFVAREAQPGEKASSKADGLIAHQFMVGRGSGIAVDPLNPQLSAYRAFAKNSADPDLQRLSDVVDWDGTKPLKNSQWNRASGAFDLQHGQNEISVPMGPQLENAIGACFLPHPNSDPQAAEAHADSFSPELEQFLASFSIKLKLSEIRAIILQACAQFYSKKKHPVDHDEATARYTQRRTVNAEAARKRTHQEIELEERGLEPGERVAQTSTRSKKQRQRQN